MSDQRPGKVSIHDTALHIWEDGVNENEFRGVVWGPLIAKMRERGWSIHTDPEVAKRYPTLKNSHYLGVKGALRCEARACGRHFELKVWSEDWASDHRHGHRYCFRIRERMPFLTGLKTDIELQKLKAWLDRTHGYAPSNDVGDRRPVSAAAYLMRYYAESGHNDKALGRPKPSSYHDARSAEGATIEHGALVWTRGRDGRVRRGRAFYKLGTNWMVVFSTYDYCHVQAWEIMLTCPAELRRSIDPRVRRDRLERLINAAVRDDHFDRAQLLRRVLFGDAPLYRILKGDSYYAPISCGYGSIGYAGRYTAAEAQSIIDGASGELQAIPIGAAPPLHPAIRAKAVTP